MNVPPGVYLRRDRNVAVSFRQLPIHLAEDLSKVWLSGWSMAFPFASTKENKEKYHGKKDVSECIQARE